jgi:hypothetical protein
MAEERTAKFRKYKIVRDSTPDGLETKVNALVDTGWDAIGGVVVFGSNTLLQVMRGDTSYEKVTKVAPQ